MPHGITLILFSVLCFIAAFIASTTESSNPDGWNLLPFDGEIYGPLEIEEENTAFSLLVTKRLNTNSWEYVTVEMLNSQQEYLFSFGKEFWNESGYDYEDYRNWEEQLNQVEFTMTINEKGKYYFKTFIESNTSNSPETQIYYQIRLGSHLPFVWTGIVTLAVAIFILWREKPVPVNLPLLIILLTIIYVALWMLSLRGWGFMEYDSHYSGPIMYDYGDVTIYREHRSIVGGGSHMGGGIHGGK